ncbi:unnamed protein product [Candida verbasci]|uniref:Essential nuclear protein 1 n=1 Tax=Candida verbasci TaxID=1227364 RepID=A0A9W4U176_9ASCO|nr:unnamed protein product [Candida verbasci]
MGKISTNETKLKQRHNPLLKDISTAGGNLRTKSSNKKKSTRTDQFDDEKQDGYLDAQSSRKILQLAKEQQEELEEEEENINKPSFIESFKQQDQSEGEDEDEDEEYSDLEEEEYVIDEEEIEVDEKDAELFNKYFQNNGTNNGGINLADRIMAKIQEKEQLQNLPNESIERPQDAVLLPPKVIMAYEKIGQILKTYTHGKLPKLFKILPSLKNWQDVLFVTNPEQWSNNAVYEATKLFVSNLTANESQKFIEGVLLERFRNCIQDSDDHSLNYHLYRALKKSLYKPGAFFKGFLIPLVDNFCTVREATIAASILNKVSIPVLHSSVALTQLLQKDFTPATTVFIRILIEKKYALPYQTLDELVFYFMRFRNDSSMDVDQTNEQQPQLPVVWHKAFLAFAQRYKNDITDDQRDFLLDTVKQRFHHAIGPEIRRELLAGKPRINPEQKQDGIMIDAF